MRVIVNHWMRAHSALPLTDAGLVPGPQDLTAEQIVDLHLKFDIMITTSEHTEFPILWLDDRGRRFAQR